MLHLLNILRFISNFNLISIERNVLAVIMIYNILNEIYNHDNYKKLSNNLPTIIPSCLDRPVYIQVHDTQ